MHIETDSYTLIHIAKHSYHQQYIARLILATPYAAKVTPPDNDNTRTK